MTAVIPRRFLLDAEALSAVARSDRTMQPWLEAARRTDSALAVSAVTLAETTDGTDRDVDVRRVLKAMRVHDVTADRGFLAGALRRRATRRRKPRDLTVDAVVAATAATLPGDVVILTSDTDDLRALTAGTSVGVERI